MGGGGCIIKGGVCGRDGGGPVFKLPLDVALVTSVSKRALDGNACAVTVSEK